MSAMLIVLLMALQSEQDAHRPQVEVGGPHDNLAYPSTADVTSNGTFQNRVNQQIAASRRAAAGRAVPALPSDVAAEAAVFDASGQSIGIIEAVETDGAVVVTSAGRVKIPLNAFGKNKQGLLISMMKKDFEALVAKANAEPVG